MLDMRLHTLGLRTILYLCTLLSFSCTIFAADHWQSPAYIERALIEVALKNEFNNHQSHLKKWQNPIKLHMVYEYPEAEQYQHLVNKHLKHLHAITQHPIYRARSLESANLKVILTTENKWEQFYLKQFDQNTQRKLLKTVCMGRMKFGKNNTIVGGEVVIPVDRAIRHRKLVTCVVEELTQILGLPNDSELVYPSIFNDHTPNDLLSGLDYLLLKLLYQPALKSNMSAAQISQAVRPILRDWQAKGIIQTANQQVRKGALYQLLGFE